MKKPIILAIDQSFTCSGIVVMQDSEILFAECFKTTKAEDIFTRAWKITNRISELVEQYTPDIVSLEGLAFGGIGNATRDLAGLQFVIVTRCKFIHDIRLDIIAPGTIKKFATGKGNAKKTALFENLPKSALETFLELGAKKTTGLLDLTDAYWIGRTIENIVKLET